jgi:CheY-like chemotaxis protein
MRILVVEDHGYVGRMLARLLRLRGHDAEVAESVAEAMEVFSAVPFDLLLCDIGLPDGDGWQLAASLLPRYPYLRAIALSGYSGAEYEARSKESGFAEHLTKPIAMDDLESVIKRVMALAH